MASLRVSIDRAAQVLVLQRKPGEELIESAEFVHGDEEYDKWKLDRKLCIDVSKEALRSVYEGDGLAAACLSSVGYALIPIIPKEANQIRVQPTTEPAREHRVVMAFQTEDCEICRVMIGGVAVDRLAGHPAHAACAVRAKEDRVRRRTWDLCSRHQSGGRFANTTRTLELWTIRPSRGTARAHCCFHRIRFLELRERNGDIPGASPAFGRPVLCYVAAPERCTGRYGAVALPRAVMLYVAMQAGG